MGKAEYLFITIAPRSTLARSGSSWTGPINGSNRTICLFNREQTNDLSYIELFEIELFDPLSVCKQVTDV